MRVSRLYLDQPLSTGEEIGLDARGRHYVQQVLRLRVGQTLTLFNGDGNDYSAELLSAGRRDCRVRVGPVTRTEPSSPLRLRLAIGISRGERMDFAIQKSVELGVHAITPLHTERSLVQLEGERLKKRLEHWRGVVVSACEQSGRARIPRLRTPVPLDDWLSTHPQGLLLFHGAERSLADLPPPGEDLSLLIGPEGGLSEAERGRALAAGFSAVLLGPRILRTETAPLAALAAIQVLWGDLR